MHEGKGFVHMQVPLDSEYSSSGVDFTLEKPEKARIPVSMARRLFSETVQAVTSTISPDRRLNLHLHVILRVGEKRNFFYVHQPEGTMIAMKKWDEVLFARLLARAVPSSLLSEKEADDAAHEAIVRSHATINVEDLKAE